MPSVLPSVDTETPPNGVPKLPSRLAFAPIAADIAEADHLFAEALAGYRSPVAPLIQHLKHYRGKRLRPALLLLTAKACGGITPHHHILAAAVEMIHTATLVHDDVLDDATTRRHVPTFNAEWGNKVSILLGDMLFTQAFHITSRVDRRACELIGEATNRVCGGELKQVCNRGNWHLSEADYFDILDGKTAALTAVCGRLGAVYAGASDAVAEKLVELGARHVAVVGHLPDLGVLAGWLVGGGAVDFDRGSAALIHVDGRVSQGSGSLRWLVNPDWYE